MTTGTESGMTTFAQAVEAVRGGADPDQMAAGLLGQMTERGSGSVCWTETNRSGREWPT